MHGAATELAVPQERFVVTLVAAVARPGTGNYGRRCFLEPPLPILVCRNRLLPDSSVEVPGAGKPGTEWYLGQQHQLTVFTPHVSDESAPG
jgi:hypothetical protein